MCTSGRECLELTTTFTFSCRCAPLRWRPRPRGRCCCFFTRATTCSSMTSTSFRALAASPFRPVSRRARTVPGTVAIIAAWATSIPRRRSGDTWLGGSVLRIPANARWIGCKCRREGPPRSTTKPALQLPCIPAFATPTLRPSTTRRPSSSSARAF